ncbi:MAG: hypothetical protein HY998_06305 [candidate division NC10 bacterium]|nr:hypothetical protein [candidate division NC10 bacterium]
MRAILPKPFQKFEPLKKDVKLSNISRSLGEEIALIKTDEDLWWQCGRSWEGLLVIEAHYSRY